SGDFHAETTKDVFDTFARHGQAEQTFQLLGTQHHFVLTGQTCFTLHLHHWPGLATSNLNNQTTSTLQRLLLQTRINTTLKAMRRVGMQTMGPCFTGQSQRREKSTLKKN